MTPKLVGKLIDYIRILGWQACMYPFKPEKK